MDTTKIFTILCAFLLLICLVLTLTTLVIMRQALDKSMAFQSQAAALVRAWFPTQEPTDKAPDGSADPPANDMAADVLYNRFTLKEHNGKVGVYSEEGYLIRTFDISVSTLPREAREALESGVTFHSWRELIELIEDYES